MRATCACIRCVQQRAYAHALHIHQAYDDSKLLVRLNKESQDDKLGLGLVEDVHGQVTVSRIHPGYLADTSNSLMPGDVIVSVNGELVPDLETALKLLGASVGMLELRLVRTHTACELYVHCMCPLYRCTDTHSLYIHRSVTRSSTKSSRLQ